MAKKTTKADATKLARLVSSIKTEHQAVILAVRKSLDHARKAGELLSKAKAAIKDTEYQWGKWVEKKCGIKERTANNYLRIFEKWAEIEAKLKDQGGDIAHLTVRAALGLIKTTTSTPKEPVTLTALKEGMARHHIEGDPADLVALLKELGVRVPLAGAEDEGDEDDEE
jgi:hypothetical protein